MPFVILPANCKYKRFQPGDIVEMDEATLASLRQSGIYPQEADQTASEAAGHAVAQEQAVIKPDEVISIRLPKGLRYKHYREGDLIQVTQSEREALAMSLSVELKDLPIIPHDEPTEKELTESGGARRVGRPRKETLYERMAE